MYIIILLYLIENVNFYDLFICPSILYKYITIIFLIGWLTTNVVYREVFRAAFRAACRTGFRTALPKSWRCGEAWPYGRLD